MEKIPRLLFWDVPLSPLALPSLILVPLSPGLIWAVAPVLEAKRIRLRERVVALVVLVMGQAPAMERVRD
jgi:hypothetical protein